MRETLDALYDRQEHELTRELECRGEVRDVAGEEQCAWAPPERRHGIRAEETLGWALQEAPSAEVARVLAGVDAGQLPGEARVELIKAWERMAAWVAAGQQAALAAVVEATEELGLPGHLARHEVAAALRLSPGAAYDRCQRAGQLTGRLGATLGALSGGQISVGQAYALADAVEDLDDQVAAVVERRVLALAPRQTWAETRQAIAARWRPPTRPARPGERRGRTRNGL